MTSSFLRLPLVKARAGIGRTRIDAGIKAGTFRAPVRLGARSVGWLESSITAWIESRPTAGATVCLSANRTVAP